MIAVTFRALAAWPHDETPSADRRGRWTFRANWDNTLALLDAELVKLEASDVEIAVCMDPKMLRNADGWPRGDARPWHPGVQIGFNREDDYDPVARRGRALIRQHGSVKAAQRATHPDAGGSHEDFAAIGVAQQATRLVYETDVCEDWKDNVRSIALGLEALRAVSRFGITRRGQHYAGSRAALTA